MCPSQGPDLYGLLKTSTSEDMSQGTSLLVPIRSLFSNFRAGFSRRHKTESNALAIESLSHTHYFWPEEPATLDSCAFLLRKYNDPCGYSSAVRAIPALTGLL